MQVLRLSDVIGLEIIEIRYQYTSEDYDLQWFNAYIKLSNGFIIDFPRSDDDDYLELTDDNKNYFQERFDTGDPLNEKGKQLCVGQKIVDFFFMYYNNETDFDEPAYIQLSNGYYMTERNCGPAGISGVDLLLFSEKEFLDIMNNSKLDIRSFSKTLKP